jgi:hypothetical protein
MCDTTGKLRDGNNEGENYNQAGGIHACNHIVGTEEVGRGREGGRTRVGVTREREQNNRGEEVRNREMHRRYGKGEWREGGRDYLRSLRL